MPLNHKANKSTHFLEKVSNTPIHSNQIVNLLIRVPTDETLTAVQDKLAVNPLLEEAPVSQ